MKLKPAKFYLPEGDPRTLEIKKKKYDNLKFDKIIVCDFVCSKDFLRNI